MTGRPTTRIRTAVIGAGNMGARHARVVHQAEGSELVVVVDPDETIGRAVASQLDVAWAPRLDDPAGLDALVIAVPAQHHPDLATMGMEAGLAVLVEKPMATDLETVDRLIATAQSQTAILSCGFVERFNPAVMTVMEEMREVRHMLAQRHSPTTAPLQTGVAFDLAIHDVDLAIRFAGTEVVRALGTVGGFRADDGSAGDDEDVADFSLQFASGAIATVSASRISQRKIRTWQIAEEDRLIEVDLVRQEVTIYRHVGADFLEGGAQGFRQQTIVDIPMIRYRHEPLAAQWDHMLDLITGRADAVQELASIHEPHRVVAGAVRAEPPATRP